VNEPPGKGTAEVIATLPGWLMLSRLAQVAAATGPAGSAVPTNRVGIAMRAISPDLIRRIKY
jgi:hypothetical protein